MESSLLIRQFARIGARSRVRSDTDERSGAQRSGPPFVRLDVAHDKIGELFDVLVHREDAVECHMLDADAKMRHLLLLTRIEKIKSKFLCGHDERHWFVAAIPESAPVGTVRQAMEALKPPTVREQQDRKGVPSRQRTKRKTEVYLRQGEWFFLPMPGLVVPENRVLPNEPLLRSNRGGKPHWAQFCYRLRGETVYACSLRPQGLTEAEYKSLLETNPGARNWGWRTWQRDATVYVKGTIRHADHKTVLLPCWHQVLMNTENQAKAMRHVVFLD